MKRKNRTMEIAPVEVAEISRRARRQRSEAVWKLLQGIFSNGASEAGRCCARCRRRKPAIKAGAQEQGGRMDICLGAA